MFIVNYLLFYILMKSWCKLPQDGDYAEICKSYVKDRLRKMQSCACVGVVRGIKYLKAWNKHRNSNN